MTEARPQNVCEKPTTCVVCHTCVLCGSARQGLWVIPTWKKVRCAAERCAYAAVRVSRLVSRDRSHGLHYHMMLSIFGNPTALYRGGLYRRVFILSFEPTINITLIERT